MISAVLSCIWPCPASTFTPIDAVFAFAVLTLGFIWDMVVLWFSVVPVELVAIIWASKMRLIV